MEELIMATITFILVNGAGRVLSDHVLNGGTESPILLEPAFETS
jgi:hypothetical protein